MTEKTKIQYPILKPCVNHSGKGYDEDCKKCKELTRERKKNYEDELRNIAYQTVYDNWKEYLDNAIGQLTLEQRTVFYGDDDPTRKRNIKQGLVLTARKKMTEEIYPFDDWQKGKKVWNEALDELPRKLESGYTPVIPVRDPIDNSIISRKTLW